MYHIRRTAEERTQTGTEVDTVEEFAGSAAAQEGGKLTLAQPGELGGEKRFFPLFVDLTQGKIAVFGGGKIAARRAGAVRQFCAAMTVISPRMEPELETLGVTLLRRPYRQGDCSGFELVLAATDDREVNHAIYEECIAKGIPVNVSDAPHECSFYFPALAVKENVVIGITASGTDHRLAKTVAESIRAQLDVWVSEKGDRTHGA